VADHGSRGVDLLYLPRQTLREEILRQPDRGYTEQGQIPLDQSVSVNWLRYRVVMVSVVSSVSVTILTIYKG
jgi:hypothetical protein